MTFAFLTIKYQEEMMIDTFTRIYIQVVFAVKQRNALIDASWENELFKYISGAIHNNSQKLLAINSTNNHTHFLIGMKPNCCLSDLVKTIKNASNSFIKDKRFIKFSFLWQEGFGTFSYSHSQLDNVIQYINKQKEHHRLHTFREEYITFLNKYGVEYKNVHLFDWLKEM